ncbi:hypothetical protein [Neisseria sp. Ec49-e6-T10]|uniref:hypothetical protein n=1 Tax=Neisseria sp. Ec49-e6-T10 TaxID=3140744 RepID=UPI003EB6CB3A
MKYLAISFFVLFMSACTVTAKTPNKVVIDSDGVSIENGKGHGHGNGNFCPPGQAKKNNC